MKHEQRESILWLLFLLLLFWKEAGYAFVDSEIRTTKNQHKSPGQHRPGFFLSLHEGGLNHENGIMKVSIQGYEGSFHQVAAQLYYGKQVEVICCDTFREVVKIAANKKESGGGVMAIESSIAGSILPNYNLLQKSYLRIAGEI